MAMWSIWFSAFPVGDTHINSIWEKTKTAIIETCKETIGYVQHKRKKWMSGETWARVEERRQAKQKVLNATKSTLEMLVCRVWYYHPLRYSMNFVVRIPICRLWSR
jgi:hypothetical protein